MYPQLLKIGNFTLYTHGVLAVLGIIVASFILYKLAKKEKLSLTFLFDNIVYAILIGIIGARITYFLLYRDQFDNILEIFYLWQGGMVSYGGFIPGIAAFIGLLKLQDAKVRSWLPILAIALPFGLFWGRIGNIMAGEYAGVVTQSKFNLSGYVPVPLYEAGLLLIIGTVIFMIYRRGNQRVNRYLFEFLILSYTLGRFIIDFWRDESNLWFQLSLGQIISAVIFLITLFVLIRSVYLEKNNVIE